MPWATVSLLHMRSKKQLQGFIANHSLCLRLDVPGADPETKIQVKGIY